jgi:hypothetical protein
MVKAFVARALSRAEFHAKDAVGRGLVAVDTIRRQTSRGFVARTDPVDPTSLHPTGVLVAISHWRSDPDALGRPASDPSRAEAERSGYLTECIDSVLALDVDQVVVAVVTNAAVQTAQALVSHFEEGSSEVPVSVVPAIAGFGPGPFALDREVFSVGWTPGGLRNHGFYLTWAHKALFRRTLLNPGFTHFIYLEDDIRFTDDSLRYWLRFREPLAAHGLLPGYVRYESLDGSLYVVDQWQRQNLQRPCVELNPQGPHAPGNGRLVFVGLDNPYQGMYLLDRVLAKDHFRYSPARTHLRSRSTLTVENYSKTYNYVRERAALGPIFDNVPPSFAARNVVPVQDTGPGKRRVDPSCLIEHLAGNYSVSQDPRFGKIRVDELFLD